jgi:hypothetical protein
MSCVFAVVLILSTEKIAVVANKLHLVLNVPIKAVDGFSSFCFNNL